MQEPKARTIPPEPKDIDSLEELYLHGAHLEQYKHHTYVPEDYYLEALRRDPKDLRCNLAMGRSMLEKGDFAAARTYLDRAIARLKMRNDNPMGPGGHPTKRRGWSGCAVIWMWAYQLFADASWAVRAGAAPACMKWPASTVCAGIVRWRWSI